MNKRLEWIDCLKGVALLGVIWLHIQWNLDWFNIGVSSFHMAIFFIISGILLCIKQNWREETVWKFVKRKVSSLLYPYFTMSVVALLILFVRGRLGVQTIIDVLVLNGYSALWFLPCLFFAEIIFVCIFRKNNRIQIIGMFCLVILAVLGNFIVDGFGYNYVCKVALKMFLRTVLAVIFIAVGYLGWIRIEAVKIPRKGIYNMCMIIIFVLGFGIAQMANFHDMYSWKDYKFGNFLIFMVSAFLCSWSLILLFENLNLHIGFLDYIGKNSLIVFATHIPWSIVSIVKYQRPSLIQFENVYLDAVVVMMIVLAIEIVLIYCINRWCVYLVRCPFDKNRLQNIKSKI